MNVECPDGMSLYIFVLLLLCTVACGTGAAYFLSVPLHRPQFWGERLFGRLLAILACVFLVLAMLGFC